MLLLLCSIFKKKKKKKKNKICKDEVMKMVLGEFDEDVIEQMASSDELTDYYVEWIKEKDIDESDEVIINLALNYLACELENDPGNVDKVCKECLVMDYLNLHDGKVDFEDVEQENKVYTLHDILNNANRN